MSIKNLKVSVPACLCFLQMLVSAPAFGASAAVGIVTMSTDATADGQQLLRDSTIFSGESVKVKDGVAAIALFGSRSQMVFGRGAVAMFLREPDRLTVLLRQGSVSVDQQDNHVLWRIKAGNIVIMPAQGFHTAGEVAVLQDSVVVTAREDSLRVEGDGRGIEVTKGKTVTFAQTEAPSAQAPQGPAGPSAPTAPAPGPQAQPKRKGHPKLMKALIVFSVGASSYSLIKELSTR